MASSVADGREPELQFAVLNQLVEVAVPCQISCACKADNPIKKKLQAEYSRTPLSTWKTDQKTLGMLHRVLHTKFLRDMATFVSATENISALQNIS